jgi:hypothetical protein
MIWRGAAHDDQRAPVICAQGDGGLAGVVVRGRHGRRLFVAGVMLLIHHMMTPRLGNAGEQGAARPDDDVEQALPSARRQVS